MLSKYRIDLRMINQEVQYNIELAALSAINTSVPQSYTTRRLLHGTFNPLTQEGSFTLDDNVFQNVTGQPSLGNGTGTVTFITGRNAIVVMGLKSLTPPYLPSAYLDSSGILYTECPVPPSWLLATLEAISPETLGIQNQQPVASVYYAPANTTLQLSDPSLLPVISKILVYPFTGGNFISYLQTAHNGYFTTFTGTKK